MNIRTSVLLTCSVVVIGCAKKAPEVVYEAPVEVVPSVAQYDEVRQRLVQTPGVLVGRVVAGPIDGLVAVEGLPVVEFPIGSTVTFADIGQEPVGGGIVVARVGDRLHVRVGDVSGLRGPQVGDLAIRFTQ